VWGVIASGVLALLAVAFLLRDRRPAALVTAGVTAALAPLLWDLVLRHTGGDFLVDAPGYVFPASHEDAGSGVLATALSALALGFGSLAAETGREIAENGRAVDSNPAAVVSSVAAHQAQPRIASPVPCARGRAVGDHWLGVRTSTDARRLGGAHPGRTTAKGRFP
jgi:hypothetical protein